MSMRPTPPKPTRHPAEVRTKVRNMFQPRQLLKRPGNTTRTTSTPVKRVGASKFERHPAMRGIDVSPVHGRHCICKRCEEHPDSA